MLYSLRHVVKLIEIICLLYHDYDTVRLKMKDENAELKSTTLFFVKPLKIIPPPFFIKIPGILSSHRFVIEFSCAWYRSTVICSVFIERIKISIRHYHWFLCALVMYRKFLNFIYWRRIPECKSSKPSSTSNDTNV